MATSNGVDVDVLHIKLANALEQLCQEYFEFVNYVGVSGTLTFRVDDAKDIEVSVLHVVPPIRLEASSPTKDPSLSHDAVLVIQPEAQPKKSRKRGRKPKYRGVKKKIPDVEAVRRKKRGRPKKEQLYDDLVPVDTGNSKTKEEPDDSKSDPFFPVADVPVEEGDEGGYLDDGAIETDPRDEDYKPEKPIRRKKRISGFIDLDHRGKDFIKKPKHKKILPLKGEVVKMKCAECDKSFTQEDALKRHLKNNHVNCWRCPLCEPTVYHSTRNRLVKHLEESHVSHPESWGALVCDLCKLVFLTTQEMQEHISSLHSHVCSICNAEFKILRQLVKHRLKAHPQQALTCSKCGKVCSNQQAMYRHMERHREKEHGKYTCPLCNKEFTSRNSLFHHTRGLHAKEKQYKCKECDKEFNFHHSLKLHQYKHSGARPHKCLLCSKSYLTSNHLKNHMEAVHGNSKKYVCRVCNKGFPYDNSLRMHMLLHDKDRPYVCDQCGKSFVAKSALKAHEELHTNECHQCTVCHKLYRTRMLLRAHMRRHTDDGHRYMCDICGNTFMYQSTLNTHMIVHGSSRSFKCPQCDKTFKTYATLYSHRLVHEETIPFTCGICGKGFKTRERVKAHEKRHAGDKPFQCDQCGSSFPDKGGLSKHNKTVHAKRPRFQCPNCGKMANRADNLRVHMKIHNDPSLLELKLENLIVQPGPSDDQDGDVSENLPLPRRRRGGAGKKQPRVNIMAGAPSIGDLNLNLETVAVLTAEQQQQILEHHQQQLGLGGDPQQQQHIVAELPREITLTLEKVTLDKMASQGLLLDHHLPKLQQAQLQHHTPEEVQVIGSITTQTPTKQLAMHKHLAEAGIQDFDTKPLQKPAQQQQQAGTSILHVSGQHLGHHTIEAALQGHHPTISRLDQILELGPQTGGQGVVNLHNTTSLPTSQTILVSQGAGSITNPLLHLAEVMSSQTVTPANQGGINYAALQQQYQPYVATATQQSPQPQTTTTNSFVQNFQPS